MKKLIISILSILLPVFLIGQNVPVKKDSIDLGIVVNRSLVIDTNYINRKTIELQAQKQEVIKSTEYTIAQIDGATIMLGIMKKDLLPVKRPNKLKDKKNKKE